MKKKILHVLPLTENYSKNFSGAASILVRSLVKNKKYEHYIVGSTKYTDFPTINYYNINLSNKFFLSKNNEYIKKIIIFIKKKKLILLKFTIDQRLH